MPGPTVVIGASGLVGAHLVNAFQETGPVIGAAHTQHAEGMERVDLRGGDATDLVERLAPSAVICAAAVSSVERCELEPAETRAVNVTGTLSLAEAARAAGATFVFLSSEYVFDGVAGPYAEDDPVSPINEYGRQKATVEQELASTGDDWIVARVSCVYGREARRKNFVYQLYDALSEGRELEVPGDQIGTPTAAANAATVIRELLAGGHRGIFHVAGAERVLRSDFGKTVAEELGLDPRLVRPTPTGELNLAAPRPRGAGLLVDKAMACAETALVGIREGLREMLARGPL